MNWEYPGPEPDPGQDTELHSRKVNHDCNNQVIHNKDRNDQDIAGNNKQQSASHFYRSFHIGSWGSWCLSPAVYGPEAGYTLNRSPVHRRATHKQPCTHSFTHLRAI
ncbi:hypothetical protein AMECASPLE_036411 [Ameca splendens]|uniref:Uncharacterized protein n=1 Tax=Ameca splendens TaxID=208324 RepID=A0ABV1A2Z9_9TELE